MLPDYKLDTPEVITINYGIAGIGTRFLAAAIDSLVWVLLIIVLIAGAIALGTFGEIARNVAWILFGTLSFLIVYGYYILFETFWQGQTPGKRVLKIRVLRTTGHPIGFVDAFVRNVVRIVDFLPSFYGVGVVTMFISRESRRLGDYAAGTIVVKEQAPVKIDQIAAGSRPALLPQAALGAIDPDELGWNLRALTADDLMLMRLFLERARQLPPNATRTIGQELAERIANRVGARSPLDAVRFVERVLYLREQAPTEEL